MSSGLTPRLQVPFPQSTDPAAFSIDISAIATFMDAHMLPYTQSSVAPASPYVGQVWWCSDNTNTAYGMNYYDGSAWHSVSMGDIYFGPTPPPVLFTGEMWYNTTNPSGGISHYDGSAWITMTPTTPTNGLAMVSSASGWVAATPIDATARASISVETSRAEAAEALLAPLASPALTGTPTAPTAPAATNTTQVATTAMVHSAIAGVTGGGIVTTVFGRTGSVTAGSGDYTVSQVTGAAPLASPALTGTPTAPTASPGNSSTLVATTAFVASAISTAIIPLATLASPALTGTPTAPTQTPLTNNIDIATTAYADSAVAVEVARAEAAEALLIPKINNNPVLTSPIETSYISPSALSGTFNVYVSSYGTTILTTAASAGNWVFNVAASASKTLDTLLAVGQEITIAVKALQGATAYYCTAIQVDGVSQTVHWQGGTAPSAGFASGYDAYTINITKTASATYTVLASLAQF